MILKILDYLFLLRFSLLTPVWTIILYGYFTAKYIFKIETTPQLFWPTIVVFSLFVGSFYIFNQLNDLETDKINNKLFILSQNIISVKKAKIISIILFTISILYAIFIYFYTNNSLLLISFIFAGAIGILYNLPPFNWKDKAWLGLFADSFGHGMITYLAGWAIISGNLSKEAILSSLALTFGNGAIYLLTTIVDVEGDKNANKNTFAVKYGIKITTKFSVLLIILALLTAPIPLFYTNYIYAWLPLTIATFLTTVLYIYALINPTNKRVFTAFKYGVLFVTSATFLFSFWYIFVIIAVFFVSKFYYKTRFNKNYPTLKPE